MFRHRIGHFLAHRPELERLEDRLTPAGVTYHGGPLLTNVGVEALFYGSAWANDPTHQQMIGPLTSFLQTLTGSVYMDQLREYSEPGYDIGHGQLLDAKVDGNLATGTTATQAMIEQTLQNDIASGLLQAPDANRLYVVYLPANVHIDFANTAGYHSFISGTEIHYSVIVNPTGNYDPGSFTTLQNYTIVASHELAEAVTDPEYNSRGQFTGWRQNSGGRNSGPIEIGDLAEQYTGTLNGYTVQDEWSNKEYAATGTGPFLLQAPDVQSFAMTSTGTVYELDTDDSLWHRTEAGTWNELATGVLSDALATTDQVFFLTNQGNLYVYSEGQSQVLVAGNVQSFALLSGGVSFHTADGGNYQYVNGQTQAWNPPSAVVVEQLGSQGVWEIDPAQGTRVQLTAANAAVIATDANGDVVADFPGSGVWLYRPSAGWQQFTPSDATLLALDAAGDVVGEFPGYGVWQYRAGAGWSNLTVSDAALLAEDAQGDVAGEFRGYGVWEYQAGAGWSQLTVSDATLLAVDAKGDVFGEFPGYGVWEYQAGSGWSNLTVSDARLLAANASGVVVGDFAGSGLWEYQAGSGWRQLNGVDPAQLTVADNGVVVGEFPGYGLWVYVPSQGWSQAASTDASLIALT